MLTRSALARFASVTALLGLSTLGVVGTAVATAAPGSSPTNSQNEAALNHLASTLPTGYDPSNCAVGTPNAPAVASLECGEYPVSGGPAGTFYYQYTSAESLYADFTNVLGNMTVTACPDDSDSPGEWGYGQQITGLRACAGIEGTPAVIWTNEADLTMVVTYGTNTANLLQWWESVA
jgi:hypothetical protein